MSPIHVCISSSETEGAGELLHTIKSACLPFDFCREGKVHGRLDVQSLPFEWMETSKKSLVVEILWKPTGR